MIKHLNIKVTGRVQGVFYRASAREKAMAIGLKGFVRNEPDGSVYAEAEGNEEQLNEWIAWCRQGPPRAAVSNLIITESDPVGFVKFEIERGA